MFSSPQRRGTYLIIVNQDKNILGNEAEFSEKLGMKSLKRKSKCRPSSASKLLRLWPNVGTTSSYEKASQHRRQSKGSIEGSFIHKKLPGQGNSRDTINPHIARSWNERMHRMAKRYSKRKFQVYKCLICSLQVFNMQSTLHIICFNMHSTIACTVNSEPNNELKVYTKIPTQLSSLKNLTSFETGISPCESCLNRGVNEAMNPRITNSSSCGFSSLYKNPILLYVFNSLLRTWPMRQFYPRHGSRCIKHSQDTGHDALDASNRGRDPGASGIKLDAGPIWPGQDS
ncbi:unnamed protein product [Lupinus luteus]|uniref:Uncharacterized protein n=1 Tax=Lupinus luteus TaxID=3873 RepID=A0AAV1W7E7_LUPLU